MRHCRTRTELFPKLLVFLLALALVPVGLLAQESESDADAQPAITVADYGDAPDNLPAGYAPPLSGVTGRFPTRAATTNRRYGLPGAHAVAHRDAWLGPLTVVPTTEAGVQDVADPDTIENLIDDDFDNGLAGWPCPASTPPVPWTSPISATLEFDVSVAAAAPNVTRYLNVLIDFDQNGVWSGGGEWAVIDFPVAVTPGTTQRVAVQASSIPFGIRTPASFSTDGRTYRPSPESNVPTPHSRPGSPRAEMRSCSIDRSFRISRARRSNRWR